MISNALSSERPSVSLGYFETKNKLCFPRTRRTFEIIKNSYFEIPGFFLLYRMPS